MDTELKLHKHQKKLVKKLVKGGKTFNRLLLAGVMSEHMNYHLKKLIELGYVTNNESTYLLTDIGKDYSNLLDDNLKRVEKQPKTSVVINAVRKSIKGEIEFLLNRRLREPYYGKVGRMGGKVLFGEPTVDAGKKRAF